MPAPTVAVIGCGPGGLFFLHALETKRRELQTKGDTEGLAKLPEVTCFERSDAPGGVWRAKRQFSNDEQLQQQKEEEEEEESGEEEATARKKEQEEKKMQKDSNDGEEKGDSNLTLSLSSSSLSSQKEEASTSMYEALWTNGPKECIEFFDYTFDEHFGHALPVYLPRQAVLDYILARCTRNAPTLLDDHVQFNTTVKSVKYDKGLSKFIVVTVDNATQQETIGHYDKCIWAAGENGRRHIPSDLTDILHKGGFKGKYMHSAAVDNFEEHCRGKNVVIIGDNYSAEDLTLMAIKLGAEEVSIISRAARGIAAYVEEWPMDKVDLWEECVMTGVSEDGWDIEGVKRRYDFEKEEFVPLKRMDFDIEHVDLIVFCTGYDCNLSMLDEELRKPLEKEENLYQRFEMPDGWRMKPNALTPEIGDIPVSAKGPLNSYFVVPQLYDGLLMDNPSMMYIYQVTDIPLLEIDAMVWLFLAYITQDISIPSISEMKQRNLEQSIKEMDCYNLRYDMDKNYMEAVHEVYYASKGKHWCDRLYDERSIVLTRELIVHWMELLGQTMRKGGYPLDLGTPQEGLTKAGIDMVDFDLHSGQMRYLIDKETADWRTFRDVKDPGQQFWSIFTGTKAIPFDRHWLDLDDNDPDLLKKQVMAYQQKQQE